MIHRHLDYPTSTPVEQRPLAALVDILERGDLADWRPIAAAVVRDPHGAFATRLMELLDTYPAYGTSPLWRAWIDRRRARAEGPTAPATTLAALRRRLGLTQMEVADRIGISQSDLSKLERRKDLRLSTLETYATALGVHLHLVLSLQGERLELRVGHRG